MRGAIDDFVVSLAERIDILQDVHSAGDFERLSTYAGKILTEATELGYPMLAEAIQAVIHACDEGKVETAEAGLLEMTELVRRIRRAHRGAA